MVQGQVDQIYVQIIVHLRAISDLLTRLPAAELGECLTYRSTAEWVDRLLLPLICLDHAPQFTSKDTSNA